MSISVSVYFKSIKAIFIKPAREKYAAALSCVDYVMLNVFRFNFSKNVERIAKTTG